MTLRSLVLLRPRSSGGPNNKSIPYLAMISFILSKLNRWVLPVAYCAENANTTFPGVPPPNR